MTDQQIMVRAIREAQLILAGYVEPGPQNADKTINELLFILDRNDVVEAVDRQEVECSLRSP